MGEREWMCVFRPNIIANPGLHSELKHQFAQQIQKYRVNRGRMAKGESARYSHRRVLELDLNGMPAVIDDVKKSILSLVEIADRV